MALTEFHASDLLEGSGRLSYDDLMVVARKVDRARFTRQFMHPMFVGSSLYTGEFLGSQGMGATMEFVFTEVDLEEATGTKATPDPSHLRQSMYPLIKRPYAKSDRNTFTVGRTSETDMVMADYSISRKHATIRVNNGRYTLEDQHATNGTFHNGRRVQPGAPVGIETGDQVSFGRFAFYFPPAEKVYEQLRT